MYSSPNFKLEVFNFVFFLQYIFRPFSIALFQTQPWYFLFPHMLPWSQERVSFSSLTSCCRLWFSSSSFLAWVLQVLRTKDVFISGFYLTGFTFLHFPFTFHSVWKSSMCDSIMSSQLPMNLKLVQLKVCSSPSCLSNDSWQGLVHLESRVRFTKGSNLKLVADHPQMIGPKAMSTCHNLIVHPSAVWDILTSQR